MNDPVSERLGYHPTWLDKLAPDVLLEASVLAGTVKGPEAVKEMLSFARSLYDYQEFSFKGDIGNGYWLETYTSAVRGIPVTNSAIVHRNADGETDHLAMTHRGLDGLHWFSHLLDERFGSQYPEGFFYRGVLSR